MRWEFSHTRGFRRIKLYMEQQFFFKQHCGESICYYSLYCSRKCIRMFFEFIRKCNGSRESITNIEF